MRDSFYVPLKNAFVAIYEISLENDHDEIILIQSMTHFQQGSLFVTYISCIHYYRAFRGNRKHCWLNFHFITYANS